MLTTSTTGLSYMEVNLAGYKIFDSHLFPMNILCSYSREFPGRPGVSTCCFGCHGLGSVPAWGSKILQDTQRSQKKKEQARLSNKGTINPSSPGLP